MNASSSALLRLNLKQAQKMVVFAQGADVLVEDPHLREARDWYKASSDLARRIAKAAMLVDSLVLDVGRSRHATSFAYHKLENSDQAPFAESFSELMQRMISGQPHELRNQLLELAERAIATRDDLTPEQRAERLVESTRGR